MKRNIYKTVEDTVTIPVTHPLFPCQQIPIRFLILVNYIKYTLHFLTILNMLICKTSEIYIIFVEDLKKYF